MRLIQGMLITLISCWLTAITPLSAEATSVYKEVQPDGSIIYSDSPTDGGAEKVEIEHSPNVLSAPKQTAPKLRPSQTERKLRETKKYQSVKITSPANDTALRSNDGTLSVSGMVQPRLFYGHSIVLKMDGAPVGEPKFNPIFNLTGVFRGTHTLVMEIVDKSGTVVMSSEPVTFHLQRAIAK